VSESSLKGYFRAVFGEGVSDHLARLRMEKAAALLREGSLSVLEVSRAVGFANQGKFSEFFANHAECTLREYRRRKGDGASGVEFHTGAKVASLSFTRPYGEMPFRSSSIPIRSSASAGKATARTIWARAVSYSSLQSVML
jgi:AraC-like DNA-binding protein